jgi:peptidyl-prolyl cis-trans isomerase D
MLQSLRTGAKSPIVKIFTFGLLLLAMGGLAILDVQGMFRKGIKKSIVAEIGNDRIYSHELDQMVQQFLQQRNVPASEAYRAGLPRQILDTEINTRIFSLAAQDLGVRVSDEIAANHIRDMLRPAAEAQGILERDALRMFLERAGLSEARLIDAVKRDVATQSLLGPIAKSMQPPREMVDVVVRFKSEERKGRFFTLTSADAGKIAPPSEEDIAAHYQAIKSRFMQAERRDLGVLLIDAAALHVKTVTVSDDDARDYFKKHPSEFGVPEKRVIDQVVFTSEEEARAFAADAPANKAGFAAAAAKLDKKIVSGTYALDNLLEELAPVFSAKAESVTAPIKTGLGWYVVRVESIAPGKQKKFDDVRDGLIAKLKHDRQVEAFYAEANKIDDMLASGRGIDGIAEELGAKVKVFKAVDANGRLKDGGSFSVSGADAEKNSQMLKSAFALRINEATQMIELTPELFAVVEVRHIDAAAPRELAAVKEDVIKDLTAQRTVEALQKKAAETVALVKTSSLDAVAKKLGKDVSSRDWVARSNAKSAAEFGLFDLRRAGDVGMKQDGRNVAIVSLDGVRISRDLEKKMQAKEETQKISELLELSLQNDILEQYRHYLLSRYDVRVYDDVIQKMYARTTVDE